jgi:hypothetical protein
MATHDDALTHDTELRALVEAPGLGAVTCVHAVPSQLMTNVWFPAAVWERPTATHDDALTHDTESRELSPVLGLGVVACVHAVPPQLNANVSSPASFW